MEQERDVARLYILFQTGCHGSKVEGDLEWERLEVARTRWWQPEGTKSGLVVERRGQT